MMKFAMQLKTGLQAPSGKTKTWKKTLNLQMEETYIKQWTSFCLLNVDFKIISWPLVSKQKKSLPSLTFPN